MSSSSDKIYYSSTLEPPIGPRPREPIGSKEKSYYPQHNFHKSSMEDISRQQRLSESENEASDDSIDDGQISSDEHIKRNETKLSSHSQNDFSYVPESSKPEQDTSSFSVPIIILVIAILFSSVFYLSINKKQAEAINSPISLFKSIEEIKTKFYNQESDTWNDISSAINEIMIRNPKIPQIILLFANETTTMDCLATALADVSKTVLNIDSLLNFNPKNFGDDAGEIIDKLNKHSPEKKVVIIRNVLNINAEAIKALHNLCDKENPLIREAIYIFTMQINNYQSSQQKLKFVENQFYRKLSKSIDQDILMALVTRITDGAIILVQPEPHLIKYNC